SARPGKLVADSTWVPGTSRHYKDGLNWPWFWYSPRPPFTTNSQSRQSVQKAAELNSHSVVVQLDVVSIWYRWEKYWSSQSTCGAKKRVGDSPRGGNVSTNPQSPAVLSFESFESQNVQDLEGSSNHQQWYAVFTLTRHEKRVRAQCEEHQIESFLPTYKVKHRWKNRRSVQLELPLFPGYSFVRIEPRTRLHVLQLPGVISIVSSGRKMLPIPDEYMNSLREGLLVHRIEPHPGLALGCRVRISQGPMAGAVGILERDKSNFRV